MTLKGWSDSTRSIRPETPLNSVSNGNTDPISHPLARQTARAARALLLSTEVAGKVYTHLSAFSKEMIRAENLVRNILSSAEVVKTEEAEFHEQSVRMEKGVHFWPMLHLVCLIVAAYMQVRHIVQFMKSKHIC